MQKEIYDLQDEIHRVAPWKMVLPHHEWPAAGRSITDFVAPGNKRPKDQSVSLLHERKRLVFMRHHHV
jgi:hypothetical protein